MKHRYVWPLERITIFSNSAIRAKKLIETSVGGQSVPFWRRVWRLFMPMATPGYMVTLLDTIHREEILAGRRLSTRI
jgi:hypothetical protein